MEQDSRVLTGTGESQGRFKRIRKKHAVKTVENDLVARN